MIGSMVVVRCAKKRPCTLKHKYQRFDDVTRLYHSERPKIESVRRKKSSTEILASRKITLASVHPSQNSRSRAVTGQGSIKLV